MNLKYIVYRMKLYGIRVMGLHWLAGFFYLLVLILLSTASVQGTGADMRDSVKGLPLKITREQLGLTTAEHKYLNKNPVIRYTCDPAWPPFSFIGKDGTHNGIDADLLHLLADRLKVTFQFVPAESWKEAQTLLENGQVDLIPGVADLEERRRMMYFTDHYASIPVAIIVREDAPFQVDLVQFSGVPVAAPRDYVTTRYVQDTYPEVNLVITETAYEAMDLLSRGVVEATVENLASASYIIKTSGFTNLKIGGVTALRFEVRLAVSQTAPLLASSLNKALKTVSEAEHFAIKDRWISAGLDNVVDWWLLIRYAIVVTVVFLLLLGVVLYWNRRLAKALAARQRVEIELRAAHLRLQNLNEEKTRFLEIAAHDLKSPLTGIVMASDLLQMENALKEARHLRLLGQIRHFAQRMNQLIETLLRTNAIDRGLVVQIEPLDIIPILNANLQRYEFPASTKRIDLKSELLANTIVLADRTAIDHIVENLLSNAIKFSPSDTVVVLKAEIVNDEAVISISDQGPGIRDEEKELLFRRYKTLSAKPTGIETSSGLGLSLVMQLVERMHGRIWYERANEGGSVFRVALPLVKNSQKAGLAREIVSG